MLYFLRSGGQILGEGAACTFIKSGLPIVQGYRLCEAKK